jgi:hypothetical protein
MVVFLCISAVWESSMTPRRPIEGGGGGEGSHRESFLLPIGTAMHFFYPYGLGLRGLFRHQAVQDTQNTNNNKTGGCSDFLFI